MPKPPLPENVAALLARPNPCVMATVRADGSPVTVATWYLWVDGRVLLNLDASRKRLAHLRRDPRVALTVLADDGWNRHVSLQGRVVSIEDDTDLADIDRLAMHYHGKPYPVRDQPRVTAWMEIDTWFGWGLG